MLVLSWAKIHIPPKIGITMCTYQATVLTVAVGAGGDSDFLVLQKIAPDYT